MISFSLSPKPKLDDTIFHILCLKENQYVSKILCVDCKMYTYLYICIIPAQNLQSDIMCIVREPVYTYITHDRILFLSHIHIIQCKYHTNV